MATYNEIQLLTENILPTATETFEKMQEGYRQGKFGYLDVLDAERTLFNARQQYLDALTAYHTQLVRLERLTGLSISPEAAPSMDSARRRMTMTRSKTAIFRKPTPGVARALSPRRVHIICIGRLHSGSLRPR